MIPEDEEAQKIIVSTIKKQYPEDSFLAEEELDEKGKNTTRRWIIDGLDGTGDFIHNGRHFCCAIALSEKEKLTLGVIINRMGDLFLTSRDRGAYFVGAQNPQFLKMQVSTEQRIRTIQGITHSWVLKAIKKYHSSSNFSSEMSQYAQSLQFNPEEPDLLEEQWQDRTGWGNEEERRSHPLETRRETRRKICETRGSSSLQEAYLATGALDWYINGPLHPWDAAAGTLLIKEAGGEVTNWKGEKRKIFERGPILASNGLVHDQLVELMEPIVPPWE
jgi:myo-inositol-1(or 4)-monophosphatase